MDLLGALGGEHWPAAGEVGAEHAGGEDRHSLSLGGDRADQPGLAEDEEGLDLHAGDAFDQLLLRVSLFEHPRLDAVDRDPAAVTLGLDREDAPRADQKVIDVAVAERYAVERQPAVSGQLGERGADAALALSAPQPAVDLGLVPAVGGEHRSDRRELEESEWIATEAEDGAGCQEGGERPEDQQEQVVIERETASTGVLSAFPRRERSLSLSHCRH